MVVVARWWDQRNGEKRRSSERSEGHPSTAHGCSLVRSAERREVKVIREK